MDSSAERRRYHPTEESVPLSEAVREAIGDHEKSSLDADELELYSHVNPEAIDGLFEDTDGPGILVRFDLPNVMVSIWSDGAIDIRVSEKTGGIPG